LSICGVWADGSEAAAATHVVFSRLVDCEPPLLILCGRALLGGHRIELSLSLCSLLLLRALLLLAKPLEIVVRAPPAAHDALSKSTSQSRMFC
jgi:hypothetical protein